jgi:hypothetical protein
VRVPVPAPVAAHIRAVSQPGSVEVPRRVQDHAGDSSPVSIAVRVEDHIRVGIRSVRRAGEAVQHRRLGVCDMKVTIREFSFFCGYKPSVVIR